MSLVVPNTADVLMLQYIVNMVGQDGNAAPSGGNRLLRLFSNNLTPGKTTVLADVTEATAPTGYVPITLTGTSWTTSSANGINSVSYAEQAFTFTTGVTIFGYYVTTNEVTPKLLWIERFSTAPYTLPSGGGEIAVSATLNAN